MIVFMFGAFTATANEGKLSLVDNNTSNSIIYELESRAGETTIVLRDSDNNIIYTENIKVASYSKKFDLKNLENGQYYFTAEDALKSVVYTIDINGSEVKIISKKEDAKPVFRKENGMVYLNLLNLDKNDVEIKVFDSNERLVFSEKRVDEMIIEKAFNFTKAYEDNYTVVVRNGKETYYENVVIN